MVCSHTDAEIKGTERDCTRPDDAPVKNTNQMQMNDTRETEFNPDYPATLDEAIEMIVGMFDEEVEKQTDVTKGYKAGLLMGINILDTLKRISSRNEADKQFTPEQIEDYCTEMENLKMVEQIRPRIEWVENGVQIIRQLQEAMKPLKSLEKMCAAIVVHNEPLGAGKERYYVRGDMFRRIKALNPKAI